MTFGRSLFAIMLGSALLLSGCDSDDSGGETESETGTDTDQTTSTSGTGSTSSTGTTSTSNGSTSSDGSTGDASGTSGDGLYDLLGSIANDAMISGQWVLSVSDGEGGMTFVNDGSLATATDVQFNPEGLEDGTAYEITIEASPTDACSGENLSGTIAGADVTGITITCAADNVTRYAVEGTLVGVTSADGFVRLVDPQGNDVEYTSSFGGATTYGFQGVPEGTVYELVFSNEAFNCTGSANASGTLTMDVLDAVLTCTGG
jgi:hypothetical protein